MHQDKYVFSQLVSFLDRSRFNRIVAKYDVETQIPAFLHITTASVHDSKAMNEIPYEIGAYYIFDRGYNCFKSLFKIETLESYFVVRAKSNTENAVRIQNTLQSLPIALQQLFSMTWNLYRTTYEILQILSISLTDKTIFRDLFSKTNFNNDKERCGSSELSLFNF